MELGDTNPYKHVIFSDQYVLLYPIGIMGGQVYCPCYYPFLGIAYCIVQAHPSGPALTTSFSTPGATTRRPAAAAPLVPIGNRPQEGIKSSSAQEEIKGNIIVYSILFIHPV